MHSSLSKSKRRRCKDLSGQIGKTVYVRGFPVWACVVRMEDQLCRDAADAAGGDIVICFQFVLQTIVSALLALTFTTLCANSVDDNLIVFILFFSENRLRHFMQIVYKPSDFRREFA